MSSVEDFYDNLYDEWSRLDRHRIEFDITKMYLDKYISNEKKSIEEALKLLKDDGILIASFISNYAPIQDSLLYLRFYGEENDVTELLSYLNDGTNNEDDGFTTAYFTSADEAQNLMKNYNLDQLAFAGVENILGCKEREILALPEEDIRKWIELGFSLSQDKSLYGTSQHYLYIGRKINNK